MQMKLLSAEYAICQLSEPLSGIDGLGKEFASYTQTDDEISLVCPVANIPDLAIKVEKDWRGLKIEGELDFSMVGVIAKISQILADAKISIFVVSTFNTDYILVKEDKLQDVLHLLKENDYVIL